MSWREETVFRDGDTYFETMVAVIKEAKKTIDLESYIFERDRLGQWILNELEAASRRGVVVRLLIDGVGSASWNYKDVERVASRGIRIRVYHPLPWQVRPARFLGASQGWQAIRLRLAQLNRRNHRKTCQIDHRIVFAGGMNVSEAHMSRWSGDLAWKDIGLRVEGPGVQGLARAFLDAWKSSGRKRGKSLRPFLPTQASSTRHECLKLNYTIKLRRALNRERIHRIQKSQRRVWITTPYLVPDLKLLSALRAASKRGMDVRVLTPGALLDVFFMRWINRAFYPALLEAGVRIFEYRPAFHHGKLTLVDQWVTVGSSNLNHRSLLHDLEADFVLSQAQSIQELETRFLEDLKTSTEISTQRLLKSSRLQALLGRLLLVFRRWI